MWNSAGPIGCQYPFLGVGVADANSRSFLSKVQSAQIMEHSLRQNPTGANRNMNDDQKAMDSGPLLATDFPAQAVAQRDHAGCNPSSQSKGVGDGSPPQTRKKPTEVGFLFVPEGFTCGAFS
jgi:hypothetical protein